MPQPLLPTCLRALLACTALAGAAVAATPATPVLPQGAAPAAGAEAAPGGSVAEAREHLAAGRLDQALEILQALLAAPDQDEVAVRVALSEVQLQAGVPERAVETLEPISDDKRFEVLLALGRAYRALGDRFAQQGRRADDVAFMHDEARSYLELAAGKAPAGDTTAALELGFFELYVLGRHESALARAEALLAADGTLGEALLLRGCAGVYVVVAAQQAADEAAAAAAGTRAIADLLAADKALAKDRVEPWVQLAWLYEAAGRPLDAVNASVQVLTRQPAADFTTLYHLAVRYAAEREYEAASKALSEMARRDSAQLTEWVSGEEEPQAIAGQLAGAIEPLVGSRIAEARDILKALLAAEPSSTDANIWNNYGLFCRDSNQFEESYRAYSRALELAPDDPALHNDAAVILHYYLHRDYSRAQELYERGLELAEEELKRPDLSADRKSELRTVTRDAANNLAKLARGEHEWSG